MIKNAKTSLQTNEQSRRPWRSVVLRLMLVIVVVVVLHLYKRRDHPSVDALPPNATDIHQSYGPERYVKAKVTQAGFDSFVKKFKLSHVKERRDSRYENIDFYGISRPVWWDPGVSSGDWYIRFSKDRRYFNLSKYENGYLYFIEDENR